jgi:hypothetical protein
VVGLASGGFMAHQRLRRGPLGTPEGAEGGKRVEGVDRAKSLVRSRTCLSALLSADERYWRLTIPAFSHPAIPRNHAIEQGALQTDQGPKSLRLHLRCPEVDAERAEIGGTR